MDRHLERLPLQANVDAFNAFLTEGIRLAIFDFACKLDPVNELRLFVYESKKGPLEMQLVDFEATIRKVMTKTKLFPTDAL